MLLPLAKAWWSDTGENGGSNAKIADGSHAQRKWWLAMHRAGRIISPAYNGDYEKNTGSTKDPYYKKFQQHICNERKKRIRSVNCRRGHLTVGACT